MSSGLIYGMGIVMIAVGLIFLRMLHSGGKSAGKKDVVEWAGTVLSVLLIVSAIALMILGREANVVEISGPQSVASSGELQDATIAVEAADFEFTEVHSQELRRLSDYEGKVVVLNFWATWCAPCLDEIPDLNRLQNKYPDDLVIISISDEERSLLQEFERQLALETTSVMVPFGIEFPQPFTGAFVIRPASYVIDRDGIVRRYLLGARNYAFFEKAVEPWI